MKGLSGFQPRNTPAERRAFFDFERRIDELLEDVEATTPTPWTTVTYLNAWVPSGGGFGPLQYRKIGDIVYLRGSAKNGTSSRVCLLPVGFRPPYQSTLVFLVQGGLIGYCYVFTDGGVDFNGANRNDDQIYAQFSVTA